MTPNKPLIFTISSLISLASVQAASATLLEKGDWTLSEANTSSGVQCVASNKDSSWFRSEVYYLEITKLKDKVNSPAEISLRVENNKRGNMGFIANIKGASSQFVFTPLAGNQKTQVFTGLGANLSQYIELLKTNKEDIKIQGVGGSSSSEFSNDGDGFKEIISEMEKRCNKGAKLADSKFENFFFHGLPKNIDPLKISAQESLQLRNIHFEAYAMFLRGKETQAALEAVIAKYTPAMRELEKVTKDINQIQKIDLPEAKETLAQSQRQQIQSQNEIQRLAALIPQLESEVAKSQKIYDDMYEILKPHIAEHSRLVDGLRSMTSALNEAVSRINYINNRLSQISSELSSLESEASRLESIIPSQRREYNEVSSQLRDAEYRRSQFNVSAESDSRIQRNSEHRQLSDERQRVNSSLSDAETDANRIRGEKERIKNSLEQCKQTTPPADCSQFEKALEIATAQIEEKEKLKSELSRRMSEIYSRITEIENSIERQVRSEYDTLVNREQEVRTLFQNIENSLKQNESNLVNIRNNRIPDLNNEESRLSSEKPQVRALVETYSEAVIKWKTGLENFNRATDWERKEENANNALTKLNQDKNKLARTNSDKKDEERKLSDAQILEADMKRRIDFLNAALNNLIQRAAKLEDDIRPLADERAPLDRQIEEIKQTLDKSREQYLSLLR